MQNESACNWSVPALLACTCLGLQCHATGWRLRAGRGSLGRLLMGRASSFQHTGQLRQADCASVVTMGNA